jgi:hypothetical protein
MGLFSFLFKKKDQELVENEAVETVVEAVEEETLEPQEEVEEIIEEPVYEEAPQVETRHPERKAPEGIREYVCPIKLEEAYSFLDVKTETDLRFEVGEGKLLIKSNKPIRHSKVVDHPEYGYKKFVVNNKYVVYLKYLENIIEVI